MTTDTAKRRIAFDFDGTMVDTERLTLPDFVNFVEEEFGIRVSLEEWMDKYNGKAGQALLDELNAAFGKDIQWEPFIKKRNARLPALFSQGLHLAPGLGDVLSHLKATGALYCICTNSQQARNELAIGHLKATDATLRSYLLAHCFSGVEEGRRSKPSPDVYLDAAAYFKVDPKDCVAIEDTATGVLAAVAAGYVCIGYTGLSDHPDKLEAKLKAAGAAHVMHHWHEFLPLLETL